MRTKITQILIIIGAVILVYFLFQLPTSVLETTNAQENINKTNSIESALELLEGNNPMEGVFMLREILEKEPKNTQALYYLGVLSIQTAQYENAINRFNQIIAIDSSDKKAYLQLGISNYYLERYNIADSMFNKVKASGDSLLVNELNIFLNN
ncbi:MAG: tetratricopeptide repeat protein [Bacteroidota bacterium]|jgi:Flp pilus assembly protein TadD|nr:tetratricopeptide repeat protein [Bacteroidota bacterium]